MKKIMNFVLAVMMIAAMSVTSFAENAGANKGIGDYDVLVTGTYQASDDPTGAKISVDIFWSEMSFTYIDASQGEWNPKEHDYANGTDASWSANKGSITVRNHSNCSVTATFAFQTATSLNVTGTFYTKGESGNYTALESDAQKINLTTAVGTRRDDTDETKDETPTNTIYFGITGGSIDKNYNTAESKLGTITVNISKISN